MGRIVCIDYGMKRCGIAATDALQIAIHPVDTVDKAMLANFLDEYLSVEEVDEIVFGHPELISGRQTPMIQSMTDFIRELKRRHSDLKVVFHQEDYSSFDAARQLVLAGVPKKQRQKKGTLDRMSAMLILKDYLGH